MLSIARQGITLGAEFGPQTLEALLWVAETVEESVYERSSLARDADGFKFALSNPPLRVGAFSAVRLRLDGAAVDPSRVSMRTRAGGEWRSVGSIDADDPVGLRSGERIEIAVRSEPSPPRAPVRIRLELECPAIPPLVWMEVDEVPREEEPP